MVEKKYQNNADDDDLESERITTEVPQDLVVAYKNMELVNTYVSIKHFQVGYIIPDTKTIPSSSGLAGWHKRIQREDVDIRELVNDDDDDGAEDEKGIVDCVNVREVQSNRIGQVIVLPVSFIRGPRDMPKRFSDAMTLVQDAGKPDILLTMTCNPNWPEIVKNLYEGQTAQDRPDPVTKVFRAKIKYLKHQLFTKHILGVVSLHIYVIEFQK
nr:hypothetical protein [Tanacetum cinerariifolium]